MRTPSISLALAIVLLCPFAYTQWVQTDSPYSGWFETFACFGNRLFVGTSHNGVLVSSDSGATWTDASTGLEYTYGQSTLVPSVLSLAVHGSNLFAGTYFAGVYWSADGGVSWIPVNSGLVNKDVRALCVSGATLFAGTASGIFSTTDNGSSWIADSSGLPAKLQVNCLMMRGNSIFAGTAKGVFVSSDQGASWTEVNSGLEYIPRSKRYVPSVLSLVAEGKNMHAGTDFHGVYVSIDSGTTWKQASSSFSSLSVPALLVRDGSILAGTTGSGVYCSTDGGSTWTAVNSGMGNQKVAALAQYGACIFAGTEVGVYSSSDGAGTWSMLPLRLKSTSIEAFASDGQKIYTVASRNNVFRSLDDGMTWTWMGRPTADFHAYCLAVAGHTLLIGGTCTIGRVERSTDNGVTWVRSLDTIGLPYGGVYNAEAFAVRPPEVLVGGTGVWSTSDEGVTWRCLKAGAPLPYVLAFAVIDSFVFAGGYQVVTGAFPGVHRLQGSDTVWSFAGNGLPAGFDVKCLAANGTVLFAGGWSGGVYRSTDYGTTWDKLNQGLTDSTILCLATAGSTVLAGTNSQGVFRLADDGASWVPVNDGLPSRRINALNIHGDFAFAGSGDNYGVWRRRLSEVSVSDKVVELPVAYLLEQNYPNPFNPSTTIRYGLPARSHLTLTVFNTLGQQVAVLQNGEQEAGYHEVKFDGKNLSSGVYFYRIQAGEFVATKRILLLH